MCPACCSESRVVWHQQKLLSMQPLQPSQLPRPGSALPSGRQRRQRRHTEPHRWRTQTVRQQRPSWWRRALTWTGSAPRATGSERWLSASRKLFNDSRTWWNVKGGSRVCQKRIRQKRILATASRQSPRNSWQPTNPSALPWKALASGWLSSSIHWLAGLLSEKLCRQTLPRHRSSWMRRTAFWTEIVKLPCRCAPKKKASRHAAQWFSTGPAMPS
mmetsp:Transcript_21173/g.63724  ORF Transcript_21173/g.63724 Transcript_21173/m.63724 type:complete len:216 (+) Transcript_21173:884-1531(+)